MRLQLRLTQQCSVCRNNRDEQAAMDTAVEARLFGAKAYRICCACGQEVVQFESPNYRARFRRWLKASQRGQI